MIPHSENDSTVFEANVLIVHFTLRSSMSATLHQRRHAYSSVFAQMVAKKTFFKDDWHYKFIVRRNIVIPKFDWGLS